MANEGNRVTTLMDLCAKRRSVRGLSLQGADLVDVDLSHLRADDVDLSDARLSRSILRHARLSGCNLKNVSAENVDLSESTVRQCILDGSNLKSATLVGARLEDSSAAGTNFTGVSLERAHLSETSFVRAIFEHAKLDHAEGDGVVFRGADLRGASLRHAKLRQADFRGADLSRANLGNANLDGADLRGAVLDDVVWTDVSSKGAKFDEDAHRPGKTPAAPATPPSESVSNDAVDALTDLLRHAVNDPRLRAIGERLAAESSKPGGATPTDARNVLEALRAEMAGRGIDVSEVLGPFDGVLNVIESAPGDEPPEALRAWLEEWMKSPPPAVASIFSKIDAPPVKDRPKSD